MQNPSAAATVLLACLLLCPGLAAAAGDVARGQTLFGRCSACHSVDGSKKIGPTLQGISGRNAGAVEEARYSKALSQSNIRWDETSLDAYLEAPAKLVRGTTMTIRTAKPEDRADLIAYLKSLQ
ncbi:c-type cytochrome [Rhizobium sp. CECT 9324]|uniref:c-type cytochrome n=1 Tax=Rhizobium sp. CECT 9324 TaxID=2845820 RepID=UPI001E341A85|nr:c-type cytochrome [Rhizobium sp. CECT 9324]CAH0342117.1 Cytochrome c2 [Rhizobium sp. CECT 9324]